MPALKVITFAELIRDQYTARGDLQEQWLAKLQLETSVSRHSLRAAYLGTRVTPETARTLVIWAAREHKVQIDGAALIYAPVHEPRKPRSKPSAVA